MTSNYSVVQQIRCQSELPVWWFVGNPEKIIHNDQKGIFNFFETGGGECSKKYNGYIKNCEDLWSLGHNIFFLLLVDNLKTDS